LGVGLGVGKVRYVRDWGRWWFGKVGRRIWLWGLGEVDADCIELD
jgi:hypothetical protein